MAQVVQEARTKAWIDEDLDYLLREWSAIPGIAREWDDWDELDRLVFVLEWPLRVDRMTRLEHWADQQALTDAQQHRYAELLKLIASHKPTLDRLLGVFADRNDTAAKAMAAYLGVYRKWAGPNQEVGILNKRELVEIGGEAMLADVMRQLRPS